MSTAQIPPAPPGVATEVDHAEPGPGVAEPGPGVAGPASVDPPAGTLRSSGLGRVAHVVNDLIGWRDVWLIVTGLFLMLAGVALRQTTSAFFTGQAQPVVSSFRTAVVNLQPQVVQTSMSNLLPGSLTTAKGSLLNGGDVPVNLFLAVIADVSSNLDADASGGLRIAGFRCRNAQSLPVPCDQAVTLVPITSLVTGGPVAVATNNQGGVGLPMGVGVSGSSLQFPLSGGTTVPVIGVPVLTSNNRATGCALASEGAACYLGSFGGSPITTPATTVPWGARAIDLPDVTSDIATATSAIPGSLEYVVLYVYLPGTAPAATMQGQSTTLSYVFAAVQAPGGVNETRPSGAP